MDGGGNGGRGWRTARVIAHRGASGTAPENTLAAFFAAKAARASAVEFDVSLLGDGTPVLIHDDRLERCSDASGPISGIGAGDLAEIDAGAWFAPAFAGTRIPTLAAALDALAAEGLLGNLEMKPHDEDPARLAAAVAAALDTAPGGDGVLVSSFSPEALGLLTEARPMQPTAILYETPGEEWTQMALALGARSVHLDHRALKPEHLATAEALDIAIRVYTLNEPAAMAPTPGLAGVITDHPARILADPVWGAWARG